jgi:hypothetical protein
MSAVPTTAAPPAVRISLAALVRRASLPFLFVASCAYQFLQARGHAGPTVFNDELLYAKLSQAFAAGHWLEIRGAHYGFPAPVAPLVQAPAWLLGSMTDGYAAAKLVNAVVMSSTVFPAYWLARGLVRRSFALLVAAATVATPAMLYHAYLMSEAAAYPVFVLAVAVLVRGVVAPSRAFALAVPLACVLAVATDVAAAWHLIIEAQQTGCCCSSPRINVRFLPPAAIYSVWPAEAAGSGEWRKRRWMQQEGWPRL